MEDRQQVRAALRLDLEDDGRAVRGVDGGGGVSGAASTASVCTPRYHAIIGTWKPSVITRPARHAPSTAPPRRSTAALASVRSSAW